MIAVAGGVYLESCLDPDWQMVFGSGGRAAAALASVQSNVTLHTYASKGLAPEAEALAATSGFGLAPSAVPQSISFDYLHCMSRPIISPHPERISPQPTLEVNADVILRFGFMEGDARVKGHRVVYDPQSHMNPSTFSGNGSKATHLAVVANEIEICEMGKLEDWKAAARQVMSRERAEVVVVKRGSQGAWVLTSDGEATVPAYAMPRVFSIGSGDIFSAAFTLFWGVQSMDPLEASDLASRSAALYCHSRSHHLLSPEALRELVTKEVGPPKAGQQVYLAGPFFNLAQRWLIEEARNHLMAQGLTVFSPLHDVGMAGTTAEIATKDLEALDRCDRVLALLDGADPGTIFEVGYARSKGIPVVAFVQQLQGEPLTMIEGTGCELVRDFTTSIYRTCWMGRTG